jgi:hypothetical protein
MYVSVTLFWPAPLRVKLGVAPVKRYAHPLPAEALSFARAHARAAYPKTAGQTRINPTLSRP